MGAVYGSLERDDDVLAIGMNRAMDLLAKKLASVRTIGPHPADKQPVSVRKGRFGPYVQHGKTVANLPRGVMMDDITLDEAVALLKEKGKTLKPRGRRRAAWRQGCGGEADERSGDDAGQPRGGKADGAGESKEVGEVRFAPEANREARRCGEVGSSRGEEASRCSSHQGGHAQATDRQGCSLTPCREIILNPAVVVTFSLITPLMFNRGLALKLC